MDRGGGTPRPVLLTGAKESHLGCLISFELLYGRNFRILLKKKKNYIYILVTVIFTLFESFFIPLQEYSCELRYPWKAEDAQTINVIQATFTDKITEV